MPFNGDAIAQHVGSCDFTQSTAAAAAAAGEGGGAGGGGAGGVGGVVVGGGFEAWLAAHVVFHNTMVDRITSHRDGDVRRCCHLLQLDPVDEIRPEQLR